MEPVQRVAERTDVRRGVLLALVWGAATAFALAFAALTKIGPVVLTLTARHGLHAGDLVALVAAYSEALVLTRRLS
jgi:hypothetical protein